MTTTPGPLALLVQEQADNTKRWFPNNVEDLRHMILGLVGEAGEVANLMKKLDRGDFDLDELAPLGRGNVNLSYRGLIAEEVVDVLIYALNIWNALGVDPDKILKAKNEYNEWRFGGTGV